MFNEKEYHKAWVEANKDKRKTSCQKYRETHRDEMKSYRESNKEKIKQHDHAYYMANKDKLQQQAKEYREKNKDKLKEARRLKHAENKDKINELARLRRTPEKNKRIALKSMYGLTLEQYNSMLNKNNGKCPICGVEFEKGRNGKQPCVDHCHKTGKVRGIICSKCNAGIGNLNDNIQRIRKAADWLESFG
jgi:hypothetical protein